MVRVNRPISEPSPDASPPSWTFLTNHGHVLLCLAQAPHARLREVAEVVGITERAVQKIVGELERAGALTRTKEGRRNHYKVNRKLALRHPVEQHRRVGDLLDMVLPSPVRFAEEDA